MKKIGLVIGLGIGQCLVAQTKLDLNTLTDFKPIGTNWHKAGEVWADLNRKDTLLLAEGTGIIVNQPLPGARQDLYTNFTHGDIDIELDYMMAPSSNSGIYLQGRYEIQLLDSWDVLNPRSSDNCGIYERWNESKPEGQKGYDGHAPRLNASRAPGLWQHLKISFQAPRFNGTAKIQNAKMLRVELNGVLIHENVDLSGPTRGSVSEQEIAEDALRIQGDHGTVAFRNIVVSNFNKKKPSIGTVHYSLYKGNFKTEPDYKSLKSIAQNSIPYLTSNINDLPKNEFLLRYNGTIHIEEAGEYQFSLAASGGNGSIRISNTIVVPFEEGNNKGNIALPAGDIPFQVIYSKYVDWVKSSLIATIKGPGIREFMISNEINPVSNDADPVLINASENTILRSFMDIPNGKRVVHAVNVGTPQKIHYTYDMDNGAIVQVWRGNFLDATPMWHSRGDGSSRPAGVIQYLGDLGATIQKLAAVNDPWSSDTTGSGFRTKGYILDDRDRPTFKYMIYGALISDASTVLESRQGIQRAITVTQGSDNLYIRLAQADKIEDRSNGLYIINHKSFYIKVDDSGGAIPFIREQNGRKELLVPIKTKLIYSILF
ncbi:MAG: family 16 glycoside hydrolase [Chitinophagaceae bacterium]